MAKGKACKSERKQRDIRELSSSSSTLATASTSRLVTPTPAPVYATEPGKKIESDYQVHELASANSPQDHSTNILLNTALLAGIEVLESENIYLKSEPKVMGYIKMEDIQHHDKLVCFYTGFSSFSVFTSFFELLGPVVEHLHYCGSKEGVRQVYRTRQVDLKNQLFLTLIKLKLNLKLSLQFGLSTAQISRYLTTWIICFLYHHLKELESMPSVAQVKGILPAAFQEIFPTTYAIIDGSEVFIETPSDLHMQSSM